MSGTVPVLCRSLFSVHLFYKLFSWWRCNNVTAQNSKGYSCTGYLLVEFFLPEGNNATSFLGLSVTSPQRVQKSFWSERPTSPLNNFF